MNFLKLQHVARLTGERGMMSERVTFVKNSTMGEEKAAEHRRSIINTALISDSVSNTKSHPTSS
jgi:hypothetical protein